MPKDKMNRKKEDDDTYRIIFDNLPMVAFTLDTKGGVLEGNKHAETLFGMKIEEVRGKKFSDVVTIGKMDLLKAFVEFRKNLAGKVTEKTVYNVRLKNGKDVLLELIGIPLKGDDKVTKVIIVGEEVTERKTAEAALKESEEKYRFLVENTDELVLVLDKMGKVLFVNSKALKTLGYSKEEVVGKPMTSFLTKTSVARAVYALAQEFLGRPQPGMELEAKAKSGEARMLYIYPSSIPIHEKGKTIGLQVNCRDVTDQKKAEEELKRLNEELRSKVAELEKINKLSVGRELRMVDLKKRIRDLEDQLKKKSGNA